MDAFPAFFPLVGRRVVVAGSGDAADNKARLFEGSPAELVQLSEAEAEASSAFVGASLVFIASPDETFLERAAQAARAAGAPVNVVDHPTMCDFYTPAVIDRGAVVAAVGATGAAPLLAAMLRNDIEGLLPEGVGRIAALFRATRDEVRAALPEIDDRRVFLRDALIGPAADAAMAGDMEAALRLLRETLAALDATGMKAVAMGRVDFVVGEGPADLISLRAARALSQADVLIADPRCPPQIAAMARRDARRLPFSDSATLKLIELAGEGLRIVCVVAALDPSIPRSLALAQARVSVLTQATA